MRVLIALFLVNYLPSSYAVDLSDFLSGFLVPSTESGSVVDIGSNMNGWHCNRRNDNISDVFCGHHSRDNIPKNIDYSDTITSDKTSMLDRSSSSTKVDQYTFANQITFQDLNLRNSLQHLQSGLWLPITPDRDIKMNINQQQIQFNIKY